MRNRFDQQLSIGKLLIADTVIPMAKRNGPLPALFAALKEIFTNPKWNSQVFEILDRAILPKNNTTGRPGMDLWQIFVLSQVRLCKNICYDDLHYMANHDMLLRQLMGVETESGYDKLSIGYQRIIDNVDLLTDETVRELNQLIVAFGHDVFKKKGEEALRLKTDSFVVESNVHFPTDYNLLWDSGRKCLDMVSKLVVDQDFPGWRKLDDWLKCLKNLSRAMGIGSASGGKGKEERVKNAAKNLILKAKTLLRKLEAFRIEFQPSSFNHIAILAALDGYMAYLEKHIDLVDRRILKGETIPHAEKVFSIFEEYTEWVTKGKKRPNVELGKKAGITTDQYHLIVDYQVMDHEADSQIVSGLAKRILPLFKVDSWSFDKGYWHKDNKKLLVGKVDQLVLPKKGKCNKEESAQEKTTLFKKLRNKHSAVESNINELEHRGLDRCPDRGYAHFKRYIGLGVSAYNLRKIGAELIAREIKNQKSLARKQAA
ncbi:ISNCY family transposase [Cryomorpha ignava]|uniref:ISNCY family transposase n=1 Tax=Cryomorpha ignava TaxID=101383 RepID=A0A7K3WW36_9FLAO|nr:ISNCY family transposase [Cryomorpha ignava]NEN25887.1 ISNCY family transposase [Cryomorpha ignava]